MNIAIVTFDGFNEIDSFVAAHILNRVPGFAALITAPADGVTSMNGVAVAAQRPLGFVEQADAVIVGSGRRTREHVRNDALMERLRLDPRRQLVASQCSGALVLMRLGLLREGPVCTDGGTRKDALAAGFDVPDRPFHAQGNVATAGGCLASHYLAAWIIWRLAGERAAFDALAYVWPRGQEQEYASRMAATLGPYVAAAEALPA